MKLSIITPVYNRSDCIMRCLESVQKQSSVINIEHYIVDDGSTDTSYELIKDFEDKHDYILSYRFEKNRGVNAARNYAIKHATGDYIFFLDSDEMLTENALATIKCGIEQNPGFFHYLFAIDYRKNYYKNKKTSQGECLILTYKDWIKENVTGDFGHIIDRKVMQQYLFNEEIRIYEIVTFLKLYKHSKQQFFSQQIVKAAELGRADSVSLTCLLLKRERIRAQAMALLEMIENFGDDYILYEEKERLESMRNKCMFLLLADEKYEEFDRIASPIGEKKRYLRVIRYLKLGKILRQSIIIYSMTKNRRIK